MEYLVLISGYDRTATTFSLNAESGALTKLASSDAGENPSYMAFSPSQNNVYATNELADGRVSAYALDHATGQLARINDADAAGADNCHLSVHPSGRWLLVASYTSGTAAVLPIAADGAVGAPRQTLKPGANAHMALFNAAATRAFIPCLGNNYIAAYDVVQLAGEEAQLSLQHEVPLRHSSAAGPRHMTFAEDGRFAYVLNELDCTVTRFLYEEGSGLLTEPVTVSALPPGVEKAEGWSGAHLQLSPGDGGRFLYASVRGHDSVAVFAVDAGTGELTWVVSETGGGDVRLPRDFSITPDGRWVLVASQGADQLVVFERDPVTGLLAKKHVVAVPPKPTYVGIVPRKR
jgi:6-phosphogluconolactonase